MIVGNHGRKWRNEKCFFGLSLKCLLKGASRRAYPKFFVLVHFNHFGMVVVKMYT